MNSMRLEFIFREFVYLRGGMPWPSSTPHLVSLCIVEAGTIGVQIKIFYYIDVMISKELHVYHKIAYLQTDIFDIHFYCL